MLAVSGLYCDQMAETDGRYLLIRGTLSKTFVAPLLAANTVVISRPPTFSDRVAPTRSQKHHRRRRSPRCRVEAEGPQNAHPVGLDRDAAPFGAPLGATLDEFDREPLVVERSRWRGSG